MVDVGMTVDEAAERWEVSPRTVRRWCSIGLIVARRVGQTWLIFSLDKPATKAGRPRKDGL